MTLRDELYGRLKKYGPVIVNPGEPMLSQVKHMSDKTKFQIASWGETYRISCPECSDTRKRLWINHRWGLYDADTKTRNLWLLKCFNDDCYKDYYKQKALYDDIFNDFSGDVSGDFDPTYGEPSTEEPKPFVWPGEMRLLSSLPADHPANAYLTKRNFNTDQLTRKFDLRYCVNNDRGFTYAFNRIIIPVYSQTKPLGWQARYIGTPNHKSIAKYMSMPGWRKTHCLYNYDSAIKSPFVIVCEGPADVWRAGYAAVALFGKKASSFQAQLLSQWKVVLITLDSDVDADHDIQALVDQINMYSPKDKPLTLVIKLPAKDPGDMEEEQLHDIISSNLAQYAPGILTCLPQNKYLPVIN